MTQRQGTALITGAAKRLGRAMALTLASEGYDLALHYNTSEDEAQQVADVAGGFGATTYLFQADLTDMQAVQKLHDAVVETVQAPYNLLVNNASAFFPKAPSETDLELLDFFFNIHLKAPFLLTQGLAAVCEKGNRSGQVFNLTDTTVLKNPVKYLAYILSKKSLHDFTALAAKAFGPTLRVNAIAPGHILEPVEGNEDQRDRAREKAPMRRVGDVEDITGALQSLLHNSYLTGQTLWVDGGLRL